VKRSPVVGDAVNGEPKADVAARWIVSTVSVVEQVAPRIRVPERHSTSVLGLPINTVPVRSIPAGFKIVWSARRVMSNPSSPDEELRTTATLS